MSARLSLAISIVLFAYSAAAADAEPLSLAWDASTTQDVSGYTLYYGTASGVYTWSVNVGNQTTYTVTGLTGGTRYYFAVKAVSPAGSSLYSNEVWGIPFTDTTFSAGVTSIRAVHITELRSRINTLRTANGLSTQNWTDAGLSAGTAVRAVHINELRSALNAVYVKLGRASPAYTDSTIVAGVTFAKAAHIRELRQAVMAVE